MMNSFELLLQNRDLLKKPQKQVKIPRLSTSEVDFILTCEALSVEAQRSIAEKSKMQNINPNGDINISKINEMQVFTVLEGVVEFDPKRNKEHLDELKAALEVKTVKDLVEAILLPGEIGDVYVAITELSGSAEDVEVKIKNE